MKVIGMNEKGEYIAIVNHTELEQCADKYYGKLDKLKIGDTFNIGGGYNFAGQIKSACSEMTSAMKKFGQAQACLTEFSLMVGKLPNVPDAEGGPQ